jgi:hypothetical protein
MDGINLVGSYLGGYITLGRINHSKLFPAQVIPISNSENILTSRKHVHHERE